MSSPIFFPMIVLIAWSMFMLLWTGYVRFAEIKKSKFKLNRYVPHDEQMNKLPPEVRWKGDNYNHLMEQPTIFYATAIILALIGQGSGVSLLLAWAYVVLRILHSLVQAIANKIVWRFSIFVISSFVLIGLIISVLINL